MARNGQSGQLAIAFVSDIVPTWSGAGGQIVGNHPSPNSSADISCNMSNSPRWTPSDMVGRMESESSFHDQTGSPVLYVCAPRQAASAQTPQRQLFADTNPRAQHECA